MYDKMDAQQVKDRVIHQKYEMTPVHTSNQWFGFKKIESVQKKKSWSSLDKWKFDFERDLS